MQQDTRQNNTMSGVFGGLVRSIGDLVRAEINLATTEMTGKATRVGKEAGLVAAGGGLAFAGSLAMMAAMIRILEAILPRWLAAFTVGLLSAGAGAALIQKGLAAIKDTDLVPERTVESIQSLTSD